ncbi:MAG: acylphosphatase [Lachnospiraceae bacterium]|nr:acylphosphatase [Lachnospiraceae bacterium]
MRQQYYFYGRVQGVGFRYRAYYIANHLDLGGWVRNCDDGSVEMEVEGPEELIEQLIQRLEDDAYIRIDNMSYKTIPEMGYNSESVD